MAEYNILNQKIELSESEERYIAWFKDMIHDYKEAKDNFYNYYSNCGNIESVLRTYDGKVSDIIATIMKKHLDSLLALDIYDIGSDAYLNGLPVCEALNDAYESIFYKFSTIEENQEVAANMRAERKAGRGRVVGGGFGLGGAVKGMATAGAINAVTGAGHSVANLVGNAASAISASIEKSELYKNKSTRKTLLDGVWALIRTEYDYYAEILKTKISSDYFDTNFDDQKSKSLFENAMKVSEDKKKELLVQAITLYPINEEPYEYIVETYGDSDNSVQQMADKCTPFTDIGFMKTDILEKRILAINFAQKENIQNAIDEISEQCKFLGAPDEKYISAFERIIRKYDRIESKVDGIYYDTPEDIQNARKERDIVDTFIRTYKSDDESALLELKGKIEKEFSSLAKDKYLEFANRELKNYDVRYRTVLGKVYETREEADYTRDIINKLANLMKNLQISSANDISALRTKVEESTTLDVKAPYLQRCNLLSEVWNRAEDLCNKYANNMSGTRAEQTLLFSEIQSVINKEKTLNINHKSFLDNFVIAIKEFKTVMGTNYNSISQANEAYYKNIEKARKYQEYLQQQNEKKTLFGKLKNSVQGMVEKLNEKSYNYFTSNGTLPIPSDTAIQWESIKSQCIDFDNDSLLFDEKEKKETENLIKTITVAQEGLKSDGLIIPDDVMTVEYISQQLKDLVQSADKIDFKPTNKVIAPSGSTSSQLNEASKITYREFLEKQEQLFKMMDEGDTNSDEYEKLSDEVTAYDNLPKTFLGKQERLFEMEEAGSEDDEDYKKLWKEISGFIADNSSGIQTSEKVNIDYVNVMSELMDLEEGKSQLNEEDYLSERARILEPLCNDEFGFSILKQLESYGSISEEEYKCYKEKWYASRNRKSD